MSINALLRSGYRHLKKSHQLANESMQLAGKSMLLVSECYASAGSINANVYQAVMAAAQPYLDLAWLNADLSRAYANDADRYAREARRLYSECLVCLFKQPVSVN